MKRASSSKINFYLNRLVITVPAIILLLTLLITLAIAAPKYTFALHNFLRSASFRPQIVKVIQSKIEEYLPKTTPQDLTDKINQYRLSQGLPSLSQNIPSCQSPTSSTSYTPKTLPAMCANCTHATMLSISKFARANELVSYFIQDENTSQVLIDPQITSICVRENEENLLVYIARLSNNQDDPDEAAPKKIVAPSKPPANFSEEELWTALMNYRNAHHKSNFERDEKLCTYARKRVQDHLQLIKDTPSSEYPNPEKYPLDAHRGFATDAESGYAFDVTQVNQLAENLAYWPSATSPVHVIEWGWDSSTEGHREAQLSDDWSKGCVSGQDGFFVAIFGR